MFGLLFEILVLLAFIYYLYHDYQKAKLEGMTIDEYIRSWTKGIIIFIIIYVIMAIVL